MSELSENGRRRVYRTLLRVAWADGALDPTEAKTLERLATTLGLSVEEARDLGEESRESPLRIGKSKAERAALARGMVEVAAADGVFDPREERLLRKIAAGVGLPETSLDAAISAALARASEASAASGVLAFVSGELPASVSPQELLDTLRRTLDEVGRWGLMLATESRPAEQESIEVNVEPQPHPLFGDGYAVTVRLLDAGGVAQESHSMVVIGPGDGIAGTVDSLACAFATPEAYPALMERRGVVGDTQHPSVKDLDPARAEIYAMTACFNAQPEGLINVGEQYLRVADHSGDAEHLLSASELFAMAGELHRAQETLADRLERFPSAPLQRRLSGLRAFHELGRKRLARLLLWLGATCSTGSDPQRALRVLHHLGDACGAPLFHTPEAFHAAMTSPEGLMNLLAPPFGRRAGKVALLGILWAKTVRDELELQPGALFALVSESRHYLEPVIGPKSFAHLVDQVQKPDGGQVFVAKLLRHLDEKGYVANTLRQEADLSGREGSPAERVELYGRLVSEQPGKWAGWVGLGLAQLAAGDARTALESLDRAVDSTSSQARPRFDRASVLLDHFGDLERAEADLRVALHLDPYYAQARGTLGSVLLRAGRFESGIAELRAALRLEPSPLIAYCLGTGLLDNGSPSEALPLFDRALEAMPEFPQAIINRGIAFYRLGDPERCIADVSRGLSLAPEFVFAHGYLGLSHAARGDAAKARRELRFFQEHGPQDGKLADEVRAALQRVQ